MELIVVALGVAVVGLRIHLEVLLAEHLEKMLEVRFQKRRLSLTNKLVYRCFTSFCPRRN